VTIKFIFPELSGNGLLENSGDNFGEEIIAGTRYLIMSERKWGQAEIPRV